MKSSEREALKAFLEAGLLCNDSDLREREGQWGITGDPTEGALVVLAVKGGLHVRETRLGHPRVEEIPFGAS